MQLYITYLRLAIAELRDLPAVRVGGVPGAGVTVEVTHQPRPNDINKK